jgi:ribosomal-protein-alanine N-acetyltransferase
VLVLGPGHGDIVAGLHRQCFANDDEQAWTAAFFESMMAVPGTLGFVIAEAARHDRAAPRPVGVVVVRCTVDECEVLTVGVVPLARRRGHARRLITLSAAAAVEHGCTTMLLEVAVDNAGARAMYDALGFTVAGRRRGYYRRVTGSVEATRASTTRVDALVMVRMLP